MALNPQRMPVPPTPVMPPEGLAPVTQEVGLGAGDDAMSPTTMVLNYLKARGYQPTSENVRRALEANMRDPGVITGLRSDRGATEAEDQAAMATARGGGGGGASRTPAPTIGGPADLGKDPGGFERVLGPLPQGGQPVGGDPNTSAAPTAPSIAGSIINGIPLALAGGAGAYGMYRAADAMRNPVPDPVIDLPNGGQMPPVPPPRVTGPGEIDYTQLTPPSEPINPMEAALNRAVPPEVRPIQPIPPTRPGGSGNAADVLDEAAIAAGRKPAPVVPFKGGGTGLKPPTGAPPSSFGTRLKGIVRGARK